MSWVDRGNRGSRVEKERKGKKMRLDTPPRETLFLGWHARNTGGEYIVSGWSSALKFGSVRRRGEWFGQKSELSPLRHAIHQARIKMRALTIFPPPTPSIILDSNRYLPILQISLLLFFSYPEEERRGKG